MLQKIGITNAKQILSKEAVSTLEETRKNLPSMDTSEIAEGFRALKEFENNVSRLTKDMRNELVNSRLDDFIVEEDNQRRLSTPYGDLEISISETKKADPLKLRLMLEEKGLLEDVVEKQVQVVEGEKLYKLAGVLLKELEESGKDITEYREAVEETVIHSEDIDNEKVEALEKLGKITEEDLEPVMKVSERKTLRLK